MPPRASSSAAPRTQAPWLAALLCLGSLPASAFQAPSAGAAGPTTVVRPSGPGSVRGLAGAATLQAFTGQVSTAIAVAVPPGRGGFGPALSLAYDGALGNGPLGLGWHLEVPHVRRRTRDGVPAYGEDDPLELVGFGVSGDLVRLPDGTYRVQGAGSSVRVIRGADVFEVWTSDGTYHRLDRRQAPGADRPAAAWLVTWAQSVLGEGMAFAYREDAGRLYLSEVTWGPGTGTEAARYRVTLHYGARPDPVVSYQTGTRVETAWRLERVVVHSSGRVLRTLQLGYDPDPELPLSRLLSVTQTGLDGEGALPTVRYEYGGQVSSSGPWPVAGTGGWRLEQRGTSLVDVDGDGLSDLLRLERSGAAWRRNLGGRFGEATPLLGGAWDLGEIRLSDIDGDGRTELLTEVGATWRVRSVTETGISEATRAFSGTEQVPLQGRTVAWADLNGDRRPDVLEATTTGLRVYLGTSTGLSPPLSVGPIAPQDPGLALGDRRLVLRDANGDGLADAVWQGEDRLRVFLGRGDGTFAAGVRWDYPWTGYADPESIRLVDLNRDGLLDVLRIEAAHVYWWAGRPGGFSTTLQAKVPRPEGSDYDDVVTTADLDGDGAAELVWSGPSGLWRLDLVGPAHAAMLRRIHNGLGATTTLDYTSTAVMALEAEAEGTPWTTHPPQVMPVPWRLRVQSGAPDEPERQQTLRVRDGLYDPDERRFAGFLGAFQATVSSDPRAQVVVWTEFEPGLSQSRVLRGRPYRQLTYDGTGTVQSEVFNTWEPWPIAGLPDDPRLRAPVLRRARTDVYEGRDEPLSTEVWTDYDGEGRPIQTHHLGRDLDGDGALDGDGDEQITERRYASNDTTWVRGVVCSERTTDGAGRLLAFGRTVYDGLTAPDCPGDAPGCQCEVLRGRPTEHEMFEAYGILGYLAAFVRPEDGTPEPARWVPLTTTTYDPRGNPIEVTQGGVTRQLGWDLSGLHPVSETLTPIAGIALTWHLDWDPVQDVPLRWTDPNGVSSEIRYDALGRPIEAFGPVTDPTTGATTLAPLLSYTYHLEPSPLGPHVITRRHEYGLAPDGETWTVSNALGEPRLRATRLGPDRVVVSDFRIRDDRGRTVSVTLPFEWPDVPVTLPGGLPAHTVRYDAVGRALEQTLPDGTVRRIDIGRFETTTHEAALAPVHRVTDGQGRLIRVERTVHVPTHAPGCSLCPAPTAPAPDPLQTDCWTAETEHTATTFDAAGRVTAVTLQGGAVTLRYHYDTLGRLRHADDPDLGPRSAEWDDAGRLLSVTNAEGDRLSFGYDGAGRLVRQTSERNGDPSLDTGHTFHYDDPGPCDDPASPASPSYPLSRLGWVEDDAGLEQTCTTYDAAGRTLQTLRTLAGRTEGATTTWSPSGLQLSAAVTTGLAVSRRYDAAGRVLGLAALWPGQPSPVSLWQAVALDAAGRPLQEQYGNGAAQETTRDVLGQATRRHLATATGTLYHVTLTHTPFGATSHVTDQQPAVGLDHTACYRYDDAGRMVGAQVGGTSFRYRYDALQNMTAREATPPPTVAHPLAWGTYHHGEGTVPSDPTDLRGRGRRQLTTAGALSLGYDRAGRVTQYAGRALQYDARDRMRRETRPDTTLRQHLYDAGGERILSGPTTSPSSPPAASDLWEERRYGPDVSVFTDRVEHAVFVGDRLVARLRLGLDGAPLPADLEPLQYVHNGPALGPVVVTRATGELLSERLYTPFGGLLAEDAWDFRQEPFGWLNKPTDPDTGWSDHGARWMVPAVGRWLTPDPPLQGLAADRLGAPWGLNPYVYAQQNPGLFWDPDGLDSWLQNAGNFVLGAGETLVAGVVGTAKLAVNVVRHPIDTTREVFRGGVRLVEGVGETAARHYALGSDDKAVRKFARAGLGRWRESDAWKAAGGVVLATAGGYSLIRKGYAVRVARSSKLKPTPLTNASKGGAGTGYRSYSAFKRAQGPAGPGMHWHHVVEQTPGNVGRFGAEAVHNTGNLMRLEVATHRRLSGFYSSIRPQVTGSPNLTVRQWLSTQSFEAQQSFGIKALENIRSGLW